MRPTLIFAAILSAPQAKYHKSIQRHHLQSNACVLLVSQCLLKQDLPHALLQNAPLLKLQCITQIIQYNALAPVLLFPTATPTMMENIARL